jgi:hypothetical protein
MFLTLCVYVRAVPFYKKKDEHGNGVLQEGGQASFTETREEDESAN